MELKVSVAVLDLPPDVLISVFQHLDQTDLVQTRAACRLFFTVGSAGPLWQRHATERWSLWTPDRWKDLMADNAWLKIYHRRVQLEKDVGQLVADMAWPFKRHDCSSKLGELGEEGLEYLIKPISPGHMNIGQRHWTNILAGRLQSLRCAERMRALLARPDYAEAHIEEGALLLAQLAYPGADMAPISAYLDQLAAELRRRMAAANVSCGRPALDLLNGLLFGAMSAAEGMQFKTSRSTMLDNPPESARYWRWGANEAHYLQVPEDTYGLALKGNTYELSNPRNFLLPWVLVYKRGFPISLAVIHAAVGRRAGLPIDMVSVPIDMLACHGSVVACHPLNRMGAHAASDDEVFISFARTTGRILSRQEAIQHMEQIGEEVTPDQLRAVPPAVVYSSMCRSLAHIHYNPDRLQECRQFRLELDDYEAAAADLRLLMSPPPGTPDPPPQLATEAASLMSDVTQQQADRDVDAHEQTCRTSNQIKFCVGDVIYHKRYYYRGVIYGWDPVHTRWKGWVDMGGAAHPPKGSVQRFYSPPKGSLQPFYSVLVEGGDYGRPGRDYVAQGSLELAQQAQQVQRAQHQDGDEDTPPAATCEVQNPQIGEFFDAFEPGNARYQPNAYMRFRYPDD